MRISDWSSDVCSSDLDRVVPMMPKPPRADRDSLTLGYAGVYSTFLYAAKDAQRKYGLPARDLLVELGRLKMIGGQEDMIEDTALTMARSGERRVGKEGVRTSRFGGGPVH